MPRSARMKSKTGIYHVMLRGINRQDIFEDEEDYEHRNRPLFTQKMYTATHSMNMVNMGTVPVFIIV